MFVSFSSSAQIVHHAEGDGNSVYSDFASGHGHVAYSKLADPKHGIVPEHNSIPY